MADMTWEGTFTLEGREFAVSCTDTTAGFLVSVGHNGGKRITVRHPVYLHRTKEAALDAAKVFAASYEGTW